MKKVQKLYTWLIFTVCATLYRKDTLCLWGLLGVPTLLHNLFFCQSRFQRDSLKRLLLLRELVDIGASSRRNSTSENLFWNPDSTEIQISHWLQYSLDFTSEFWPCFTSLFFSQETLSLHSTEEIYTSYNPIGLLAQWKQMHLCYHINSGDQHSGQSSKVGFVQI